MLINEGEEVELKVGESLNLVCNVDANPSPSIAWMFNGTVLSSVPASNGSKVLVYQKKAVGLADKGEYVCVAKNDRGNNTGSVNVVIESE